MVAFEPVYQSKEYIAVLITATYANAYTEKDSVAYPTISFPLKAAFKFDVGQESFVIDTNHVLFERGNDEFIISKFDIFNTDITLSIQFLNPHEELFHSLFKQNKHALLQKRNLETEIILRKFYTIAFSKNEQLKEQLLTDLINSITPSNYSIGAKTQANTLKKIDQAKDFIHGYFHESISISDIAKTAYLSPFHFSRLFKQVTGYSPYDYLLLVRIENAKTLILKGMSITETAFFSGFNSLENFSLAFHKYAGTSPSVFKKSRIY